MGKKVTYLSINIQDFYENQRTEGNCDDIGIRVIEHQNRKHNND